MDFRGGVEVQAAFRHSESQFSGVLSGVDFSQFTKRRTRKCTFFTCGSIPLKMVFLLDIIKCVTPVKPEVILAKSV